MEGQLQLIRALQPDADTIGIVYTTSEANSVYSISVYEELATDYGFTIDAVGVTSQAEVTQAVDTLLSHGVDCLSNLTDNNVVGVLGAILEKTDEAGIPVYGSEVEQVKLGCVGGAGLDYIQLGIQTGLMAAKVLTGEAACEDLPLRDHRKLWPVYQLRRGGRAGHHHSRRHRPGGPGVRGITSVTSITKENSS